LKLHLWRSELRSVVILDESPTGEEEEENLFNHPISKPTDLNQVIFHERIQDMGERKIFADRAFLITLVWVGFLILLPLGQVGISFWGKGLDDAQFITVVTTTTGSVFGFWYLVGRYLFPGNGKNNSE
jgi:hypothetical protein